MQCLWRRIQKLLHASEKNLAFTKLAEDGKTAEHGRVAGIAFPLREKVFLTLFLWIPHIIMNWKDRCWNI